jgi:hypothetical protein
MQASRWRLHICDSKPTKNKQEGRTFYTAVQASFYLHQTSKEDLGLRLSLGRTQGFASPPGLTLSGSNYIRSTTTPRTRPIVVSR